jgi:hypothetical protein
MDFGMNARWESGRGTPLKIAKQFLVAGPSTPTRRGRGNRNAVTHGVYTARGCARRAKIRAMAARGAGRAHGGGVEGAPCARGP